MKTAGFRLVLGLLLSTAYCLLPTANSQTFDRTVIDANFPGAYQVEVADVNGDKKPDIIALGGSTCAWYENPTWKKRIVTGGKQTPGIISTATADIDGDGKAEIAIAYEFAMNAPTMGPSIYWHKTSAEAVLLLRSYYKAGRWNHLEKQALTTTTGIAA